MVRTHKTNRGNGGKDENSRSKITLIVEKVIRFCFKDPSRFAWGRKDREIENKENKENEYFSLD
jgi:hypothetical protein